MMFDSHEIVALAVWTLFPAAIAGAYLLFKHRAKRKRGATPFDSAVRQADRWIVLEIERKGDAADGILWKVRDHREVAR